MIHISDRIMNVLLVLSIVAGGVGMALLGASATGCG